MHALENNTFFSLFVFILLSRYQTVRGNGRITFNQSRIDVRIKEPTAIVRVSLCIYNSVCCVYAWIDKRTLQRVRAMRHTVEKLAPKTPWKWRTDSTIPMLLALPVTVQSVFCFVCVCACVFHRICYSLLKMSIEHAWVAVFNVRISVFHMKYANNWQRQKNKHFSFWEKKTDKIKLSLFIMLQIKSLFSLLLWLWHPFGNTVYRKKPKIIMSQMNS